MILGYPNLAEVQKCDPNMHTLRLLRWTVLLPLPRGPEQEQVAVLVVEKLGEAEPNHRAVIEKAVGYGT